MSWDDLLKRRRVVVLAEAGSGKTEELKEQARLQTVAGRFAVYARLQEVAEDGVSGALRPADRSRLASWLTSDQPGWFLIDSVDEAKLDGVRMERALRRLADGIHGAEGRAFIVISGRITDWEFRRDLLHLGQELPVPQNAVLPPAPSPNDMLISTIRHDRQDAEPPAIEEPLVVVMGSLDRKRIRLFADGKTVPNLNEFMRQIEAGNLWRFARRPLDLGWLVDYWQQHGRFGTLAQMLEESIRVRLREPDLERARHDPLDPARSRQALERIGAALVFGRKSTIAIPDEEIVVDGDDGAMNLGEVLPDWSDEDLRLLLARPIFDPATFGRVRLHNDNEGVVRSFLTACWLKRLREANLWVRALFDLLFANTYGIELTKPSMQETVAWLAIHDSAVAAEVVRRQPAVLLDCGDPASLPADVCRTVLTQVVHTLAGGDERLPMLDNDTLKRFARDDMADTVRVLWDRHHHVEEVRALLLRLIWLGELESCADLASGAGFGRFEDRSTRLFAGRAIAAVGDAAAKRRYAEHIVADCATLPVTVVWDAVATLFPDVLNVDELLNILSRVDVTDRSGGLSFDWQGPQLVERLQSRADLERLLRGLLELSRLDSGDDAAAIEGAVPLLSDARRRHQGDRVRMFLPTIGAGAARLLDRCALEEAPDIAIDCVLRLGEDRFDPVRRNRSGGDAGALLQRSAGRRRAGLWRAANRLPTDHRMRGEVLADLWQMEIIGWAPSLLLEDLDWLLADGPRRASASEQQLATNAALRIWREHGSQAEVLQRIEAVVRAEPVMADAYDAWMRPRIPSPQELESRQRLEEAQHRNALDLAARDQSWVEFIEGLRANPLQLRQLRPPTDNHIDSRIYHLWQLLSSAAGRDSRYAIDSVAPLEPMLGAELAGEVREAIIGHWRLWRPRLKSARTAGQLNLIHAPDCIGIAGVTLEANSRPDWAQRLTAAEARLATSYATLELNGFPSWIGGLAAVHPQEVAQILMQEINAELASTDPTMHFGMLQDLTHAEGVVKDLVSPFLLVALQGRPDFPIAALRRLLEILSQARYEERQVFIELALARFASAPDVNVAALYLGAAFAGDAERAMAALTARSDALDPAEQTALALRVLPSIFGDDFQQVSIDPRSLPFDCLERLVRMAFQTIRVEEDRDHPSGVVHGFDERDYAEQARNAAFNRLVGTAGRAGFDAIMRLADGTFPIAPARVQALAHKRAAEDSEHAAWPAVEAHHFEQSFEAQPRTARDLQRLALRRVEDIQHDLLHGDFAQGATLSGLANEASVQNWIADRLRQMQGRAYSVEREPHVVDENEPDVRLRARTTDTSVAVEIKVAESWTMRQLEQALREQLCGRYLRAAEGRYGVLLMVHQNARLRGWEDPDNSGQYLSFVQLVARLRAQAAAIGGRSPDSPQPEIAVLDVSSCAAQTSGVVANPSKACAE
ncbi:MAG: hypothetical protein AB7O44_31850 [Hyphomicrobiaceae bacterium]